MKQISNFCLNKLFPAVTCNLLNTPVQLFLFLITLLFLSEKIAAQTAPVKQWDARFGGAAADAMYVIQQTADGGYILGGDSNSPASGDKSQGTQGLADYWMIKTDATGVKQWDKRFGGSANEQTYSLQQTTDGGYLIGGWSESGISGDKTQETQGSSDYWVVKTDANGIKQWDARFGGSGEDDLRSAQQTTDGGYILAGDSYSGVSGDKSQPSRGSGDYWIVKINSSGVKQWDARFGGSSDDEINSIAQTSDGGYILGGWSLSGVGGDKSQPSQGSNDYWIVKTDANGVKQWDKRFGGNDHEYLYSVAQTTDGGYIVGGYTISEISGDVTQTSRGGYDFWVVKTDGNGTKQWDVRFGGTEYDKLKYLRQDADGGYLLAGWSESGISGDKTQDNEGKGDYWIVKINSSGVKQWDLRYGGSGDERLHSVPQTADGGYILGGYTYSEMSGDISQNTQGANDYWIVKLSGSGVSQTYYADADGDGYGNALVDTVAFSQPAGFVSNSSDCNDANNQVHPGVNDVCNGIDDNCDFVIDEHAIASVTTTPSGSISACTGVLFALTADNTEGVSYQWLMNTQPVAGATNQSFSTTAAGMFQVTESNSYNCSATSAVINLSRVAAPVPEVTPSGTITACTSDPVTLTANNTAGLVYQWYKGSTPQNGATNFTFNTTKGGNFSVTEKSGTNCTASSAITTINRVAKPAATITPLGDLNICLTGSVVLQANTGGGLTYQWSRNNVNLAGATNNSYTATSKGKYKVTVTNNGGCSTTSQAKMVTKSCKEGMLSDDYKPAELFIYPNPASSHFQLQLDLHESINGVATVSVMNLLGQMVQAENTSINDGELTLDVQMKSSAPDGIYLVKVVANSEVFVKQVTYKK